MTSPPACLPAASGASERPLRTRRKAALVCPRCTHTSPYDGDWQYVDHGDYTAVRCPACHETITRRPDW